MLRFSDLVSGRELVRQVEQEYPETRPVFEKFHFRPASDDCPIIYAARRAGARVDDLLVEANATIYKTRGIVSASPHGPT